MEEQQSLGQLTIVKALGFKQIGNHVLVASSLNQLAYAKSGIGLALGKKLLLESKLVDIVEEVLLKVGCRNVVVGRKESEEILEHTAGCTTGGHKLHNLVAFLKILFPVGNVLVTLDFIGSHDAMADSSCCLNTQEWETCLYLFELMLHLLLCNSTLLDLV